ncbi:MAG: phosphonate ABC transporter, permease protein PhnE [Antricoccus sp.]
MSIVAQRPTRPTRWPLRLIWLAIIAIVVFAFWKIQINWSSLADFPSQLWKYLGLMFAPPDVSTVGQSLSATLLSVQMAWLGTVLGIIVSFPLSFLAARGVAPVVIRLPMRLIFAVIRAVPEVVIAVLMLSITGLTPFTGALALAIGSVGTLGKWGYEAYENTEPGPIEAVRAVGGSRWQVVRWGLWPQVSPEVLALWLYRFEINVRASTILGLIGAGGIGKLLIDNVQFRIWDAVGMLLIVVIIVTMIIDQISGAIRYRLIYGRWALAGYGQRRALLKRRTLERK